MRKIRIHQIQFVVIKTGQADITTVQCDYSSPQAKERATEVLLDLRKKFTKNDGYSILKHITDTQIRTYDVSN